LGRAEARAAPRAGLNARDMRPGAPGNRRARDEARWRPPHDARHSVGRDAAVDFDVRRQPAARDRGAERLDLGTTASMKRWPPKPGFTVHEQDHVEVRQDERRARRAASVGSRRTEAFFAEALDVLDRAVQVVEASRWHR